MKRHRPDPEEAARVMGVALTATSEEVRAAYVRLVREHPPDRDPETFEAVRDAYEALRDPDRRAALGVLSGNPDAPLVSLLDDEPKQRRFVGPAPWLATLGKRG